MKQRITVYGQRQLSRLLREYDVIPPVSTTMQNEARRLRAGRRQEENREGMAEVASFIEADGCR